MGFCYKWNEKQIIHFKILIILLVVISIPIVYNYSINAVCGCTSWQSGSCGAGSCGNDERQQTRTCSLAGCASEEKCVYDSSCVSGGGGTTRF